MSRVPEILVGLLLIAALLAGCLGGEDGRETDGDGEGSGAGPAQVSEDTGAIWGAVSSDVFEPLGGARVELLTTNRESTEHTATSAENGEFTVSHVEPGQYILFVTRVNYEATQRGVTVQAGEITEVRFQLEPLPQVGPYAEEHDRAGFVTWAVAWQAEAPVVGCITIESPVGVTDPKSCGGLRGAGGGSAGGETRIGSQCAPEGWPSSGSGTNDCLETDMEDVQSIIVEMVWTPAGPLGEHFLLDFMCSDMPRGSNGAILDLEHECYWEQRGESPLQHRVDADHWEEFGYDYQTAWAARVFATYGMLGLHGLTGIDIGVAYEQSFEIYWTVFHGDPAPEGFSRLPDA